MSGECASGECVRPNVSVGVSPSVSFWRCGALRCPRCPCYSASLLALLGVNLCLSLLPVLSWPAAALLQLSTPPLVLPPHFHDPSQRSWHHLGPPGDASSSLQRVQSGIRLGPARRVLERRLVTEPLAQAAASPDTSPSIPRRSLARFGGTQTQPSNSPDLGKES